MQEDENLSENALASSQSTQETVISNDNGEQLERIQALENEKQKMQNEFNLQRAKLKELFMQTEQSKSALQNEHARCQADKRALQRELDELKSQFVVADLKSENEMHLKDIKAQEEISSLQQMVQDTIEESMLCKSELQNVKEDCQRLRLENCELREGLQKQQQTESTSLGPQMLTQVKKSLVRKLGGDSFQQDSIDDSARNRDASKPYAHEDAEVLRSIVEQLQEEMKALKMKLREADEKLQKNTGDLVALERDSKLELLQSQALTNKATSMESVTAACDGCLAQNVKVEELLTKSKMQLENIESLNKCLCEAREDLQKEAALRKDLEDQWQEKRDAHKTEVQALREKVKTNEQQLLDLQQKLLETKDEVLKQLQSVTDDREQVNKYLEILQADNDFLSARYLATASEIENQYINLPNTVEELQELMLRQQEELIRARVGSEFEKQKCVTSLDEIQILRDQLDVSNNESRSYRKKYQTDIKSLQDRLTEHLSKQQNYELKNEELERKEVELNRRISEHRVEIIELQDANEKLSKINVEYKAKIKILQDDLAMSEQVQKDFVKLSQTLQMSLEELRHADTEVRWQDDDDVDNCPSCSTNFTVTVRKIHCRHCGHIYCDKCLTKTVPSGPRKRIARVCDICHTLLTPNTAPYFSHESTQDI